MEGAVETHVQGLQPCAQQLQVFWALHPLANRSTAGLRKHVYLMWKVLKNRLESCHSPAHWNEKLVLGSPPHHRRRNSITSWPAGLWDVCKTRGLGTRRGHPCPPCLKAPRGLAGLGLLIPTQQHCQESAMNCPGTMAHPEGCCIVSMRG